MTHRALVAGPLALVVLASALGPAAAIPGTASLFTQPADYEETEVPWDLSGPGPHAIVHFQVDSAPTVLFGLETMDGEAVMHAYADGNTLFATDGSDPAVEVGTITRSFHRVDVEVQGPAYTITLDGTQRATLATSHTATEVVFADRDPLQRGLCGCPGGGLELERARILPTPRLASGFAVPASRVGFSVHDPADGVSTETGEDGHLGRGRLAVAGCCSPTAPVEGDELAYVHADLPGATSSYFLETSVRPQTVSTLTDGIPDHQAVLAGLAGPEQTPSVDWALVAAKAGLADADHRQWTLYLIGPDGTRTQVSPAWDGSDPLWHTARVLVDEAAGTLTVQVDDEATVKRFTLDDLGDADRIAIGDVWRDHLHYSGAGEAFYDDATVIAPS